MINSSSVIMIARTLLSILSTFFLGSCATTGSLPQSPAEVILQPGRFEQGYWPRYAASTTFRNQHFESVYGAAKDSLQANDFALVRDDKDRGVVMGEHGATLFYWNVMAGIYLTQATDGVVVKVVVVGSKDIGFIELQPSDWPSKLISSIERSLGKPGQ